MAPETMATVGSEPATSERVVAPEELNPQQREELQNPPIAEDPVLIRIRELETLVGEMCAFSVDCYFSEVLKVSTQDC